MDQSKPFMSRLSQALMLVAVAALLSACAGRPKPLNATRPFDVTEVRVTTQSMADFAFADRLKQKLDATAGRATADIGMKAILRIVVLDRQAEAGLGVLFNRSAEAATLDLVVIDADTGLMLRSSIVHATATPGNGRSAETALIGRLTADVRALLGLSGTVPHPVAGMKRTVARPQIKPTPTDVETFDDTMRISADPLLNGTVTPTSSDLVVEPVAEPALDLSKPLLSAEPEDEAPLGEEAIAPIEPVKMPRTFELPAAAPNIQADPAAEPGSPDEPCIITLDNDCSDPDSR